MKNFILFAILALFAYAVPYNEQIVEKIEATNSSAQHFSFVVMGDNRDGNYVLNKIIQNIDKNKNIKFAINNGDLVSDGYTKEFKSYLSIIKAANKPILSIIGNHEIPWYDGESNFEKIFGKTYFSFAYGNSYFIILDNANKKGIFGKQYKWLKKRLKKSQYYENRFVFMHVPLYDPRKGKYQKGHSIKKIKNAKKLNKLFDKYNVTMLFCSHIHLYFRGKWHKTPYIITGGAGAPLKKNGFYHYVKVSVNGDKIQYEVIKIDAKPLSLIQKMKQSIKDTINLY